MIEIQVKLKDASYPICVGPGLLSQAALSRKRLNLGKDAIIITHPKVYRLHGEGLCQSLAHAGFSTKVLHVPEGEKSKSASCALGLVEQIARYDVNRKVFIIALGGGVIGDLAGFVAAIYKRGVPYVQAPTTLLAQIDSSIGGKTAIDLKYGKNLVGAFYQPRAVMADTSTLQTLNVRQIRNGLAEAIKYGVIKDPLLFGQLEKDYKAILACRSQETVEMIWRCAQIKARVVAQDEKETKGIRTILNFGHTVGHAIEAAGHFYYHHGEAIALGMRVAARLSVVQGLWDQRQEQRLNRLITLVGLPQKIEKVRLSKVMELMKHDKKFIAGRNRFVLATRIGQVKVIEGVPETQIIEAIKSIS